MWRGRLAECNSFSDGKKRKFKYVAVETAKLSVESRRTYQQEVQCGVAPGGRTLCGPGGQGRRITKGCGGCSWRHGLPAGLAVRRPMPSISASTLQTQATTVTIDARCRAFQVASCTPILGVALPRLCWTFPIQILQARWRDASAQVRHRCCLKCHLHIFVRECVARADGPNSALPRHA
jgi:hypothetical protein